MPSLQLTSHVLSVAWDWALQLSAARWHRPTCIKTQRHSTIKFSLGFVRDFKTISLVHHSIWRLTTSRWFLFSAPRVLMSFQLESRGSTCIWCASNLLFFMFLVRNYLPHILSARRLPPCIRSVDSPGQPTDEGSRIVISAQLRKGILDQLHTGHQGITKCHERARQACGGLVSGGNWSILSVAVLCAAKNKSDLKGPYPHRASMLPWEVVATDLFV